MYVLIKLQEVEQMNFDRVLGKNKKKRKLGIGEGAFIKSSPSSGRFIRQHAMKIEKREPVGVFMPKVSIPFKFHHIYYYKNMKFECLKIKPLYMNDLIFLS